MTKHFVRHRYTSAAFSIPMVSTWKWHPTPITSKMLFEDTLLRSPKMVCEDLDSTRKHDPKRLRIHKLMQALIVQKPFTIHEIPGWKLPPWWFWARRCQRISWSFSPRRVKPGNQRKTRGDHIRNVGLSHLIWMKVGLSKKWLSVSVERG